MEEFTEVYVGNIAEYTHRELREILQEFGKVERLSLKGNFGFAEFADPKSAAQAVRIKNLEGGIFLKKSNASSKKAPPKKVVEASKENQE